MLQFLAERCAIKIDWRSWRTVVFLRRQEIFQESHRWHFVQGQLGPHCLSTATYISGYVTNSHTPCSQSNDFPSFLYTVWGSHDRLFELFNVWIQEGIEKLSGYSRTNQLQFGAFCQFPPKPQQMNFTWLFATSRLFHEPSLSAQNLCRRQLIIHEVYVLDLNWLILAWGRGEASSAILAKSLSDCVTVHCLGKFKSEDLRVCGIMERTCYFQTNWISYILNWDVRCRFTCCCVEIILLTALLNWRTLPYYTYWRLLQYV